jgi:hypothetical protein
MFWRSVRASRAEKGMPLPGDAFIPEPAGPLTHAITIHCSRQLVWPWLVQMGADRAGWYSYDFLDNGGRHSVEKIVPELQAISVGTLLPALPGVKDGFFIARYEPYRFMVLVWPGPRRSCLTTWTFVLHDLPSGWTRLIVRANAGRRYRFFGLPALISKPLARQIHFIMQRKQLLEIARRAESAGVCKSVSEGKSEAA